MAATATETARQAVKIAAKLSPAMRRALKYAWTDAENTLRLDRSVARVGTRVALIDRGLAASDPHALTNLGRMVRAVLLTSAAEVLDWAAREDAKLIDELHGQALADHALFEADHAEDIAEVERHGIPAANLRAARDELRAQPREVRPTGGLTEASLSLFLDYARDAGNWSGTPPVNGNVAGTREGRGNLTQMKRAGLVTTFRYDGDAWIEFTAAGKALAAEHGIRIYD